MIETACAARAAYTALTACKARTACKACTARTDITHFELIRDA